MLRIGLQGNLGSSNHRAALMFANRHGWEEFELHPLTTTEGVLRELSKRSIDMCTFVWESKMGLAAETQAAYEILFLPLSTRIAQVIKKIEHMYVIDDPKDTDYCLTGI